jgi:hypothetical protein
MRPQYSIITQPASEPITLAQASAHLRVDSADDNTYITDLIPVAREYVESVTGRVSNPTTFRLIASDWRDLFAPAVNREIYHLDARYGLLGQSLAGVIPLFRTPLVSVASIQYYAPGEATLTTMSTEDYRVILTAEPGLVHIFGDLPALENRPDAIQIQFVAGVTASTSATLKHAVKMLVSHLYENRMPVAFSSCNDIPFTLRNLIENQKIGGYF